MQVGARSFSGKEFKWAFDLSNVSQNESDEDIYGWYPGEPNRGLPVEPCVEDYAKTLQNKMEKQFNDVSCDNMRRIVCQLVKA